MAWEKRGGRLVYYSARRVGGRVVKQYLGDGPVAQATAALEQASKLEREASREEQRERQAAETSKRRAACSTGSSVDSSKVPASIARNATGGVVDERELIDRAMAGDESTVPAVRALVLAKPELARRVGDLAGLVESGWLHLLTNQNVLAREAMSAELRRLKSSLAGPKPTPIEQLLVDRVAACWVQANHADWTEATHNERTISQAELALKRQAMAHKRLLSALKTLAEVRRLMVPALQVNIAEQQVNVAGSAG